MTLAEQEYIYIFMYMDNDTLSQYMLILHLHTSLLLHPQGRCLLRGCRQLLERRALAQQLLLTTWLHVPPFF